jgi:hypothetical protein
MRRKPGQATAVAAQKTTHHRVAQARNEPTRLPHVALDFSAAGSPARFHGISPDTFKPTGTGQLLVQAYGDNQRRHDKLRGAGTPRRPARRSTPIHCAGAIRSHAAPTELRTCSPPCTIHDTLPRPNEATAAEPLSTTATRVPRHATPRYQQPPLGHHRAQTCRSSAERSIIQQENRLREELHGRTERQDRTTLPLCHVAPLSLCPFPQPRERSLP